MPGPPEKWSLSSLSPAGDTPSARWERPSVAAGWRPEITPLEILGLPQNQWVVCSARRHGFHGVTVVLGRRDGGLSRYRISPQRWQRFECTSTCTSTAPESTRTPPHVLVHVLLHADLRPRSTVVRGETADSNPQIRRRNRNPPSKGLRTGLRAKKQKVRADFPVECLQILDVVRNLYITSTLHVPLSLMVPPVLCGTSRQDHPSAWRVRHPC